MYSAKTLCCHRSFRHDLLACAKSQRMGRANCFRGELRSTRYCRSGTAPASAASSCRLLLSRHRLYSELTTGLQISCMDFQHASLQQELLVHTVTSRCRAMIFTSASIAFVFCRASSAAGAIVIFLIVFSIVANNSPCSCFVTRIKPVQWFQPRVKGHHRLTDGARPSAGPARA